jgi:hypothetical protein
MDPPRHRHLLGARSAARQAAGHPHHGLWIQCEEDESQCRNGLSGCRRPACRRIEQSARQPRGSCLFWACKAAQQSLEIAPLWAESLIPGVIYIGANPANYLPGPLAGRAYCEKGTRSIADAIELYMLTICPMVMCRLSPCPTIKQRPLLIVHAPLSSLRLPTAGAALRTWPSFSKNSQSSFSMSLTISSGSFAPSRPSCMLKPYHSNQT